MYKKAYTAQKYYATDNEEIANRMGYLERQMRNKVSIRFHKLRNGFFPKAVKRLSLYLLGNGVTLDDETKAKIDKRLDNKIIIAAINACVDGVNWGFPDLDELVFFRATEFIPLVDERTSKPMVGVRFWQIDDQKPMYIELYEIDGITEYKTNNSNGLEETAPKRPYRQTVQRDAFSETVINGENYDVFPIFPLYANELKTSELSPGIKALIDAYDFISSDLVDGITLVEGIYWVIKNYGGDDIGQLLAELQQLKATYTEDEAGADNHIVEIPFQAKQVALDLLETRMYSDWLLPTEMRTGGARAVTATEIKAAREDMDIKADLLEWQVAEFIENVLLLKGIDMLIPSFKRRTMTNDTETVNNIATKLSGGWIDADEAIRADPTIPDEEKAELLKRIDLLMTGIPADDDEGLD